MIIDVSDATFETDVLTRSQTTPVVLDFWASWCGPCKTLTPTLEKVVIETEGAVVLAKVDTEQNEQIPAAFQVKSIPAVYALYAGKLVDQFVGAKPEPEIQKFVQKLVVLGGQQKLDSLVETGDEASLRKALEIQPDHKPAVLALASILLARGEGVEVVALLGAIKSDEDTAPLAAAARDLALPAETLNDIEVKLEKLLARVKGDDDARHEYVELLETVAAASPADASRWRRRLSTALY